MPIKKLEILVSLGFILCGLTLSTWGALDFRTQQSYTLDFIEPQHRGMIRQTLNEMCVRMDGAIDALSTQNHAFSLISTGCLIFFYDNGSCDILPASRDRPSIFFSKNEIPRIHPHIFCASDRSHYKDSLIYHRDFETGLVDEELRRIFKSIEISTDRGNQVQISLGTLSIPELLPVVNPAEHSTGKTSAESYVASHLDDGEGFIVDTLIAAMSAPDFKDAYRTSHITHVYPLVCTERDACRCCLLSIRDYLTSKIREYISDFVFVNPIIVSKAVYHEKSPYAPSQVTHKIALRCYYPWVGVLPTPAADEGEEDEALDPIVYLVRMTVS